MYFYESFRAPNDIDHKRDRVERNGEPQVIFFLFYFLGKEQRSLKTVYICTHAHGVFEPIEPLPLDS